MKKLFLIALAFASLTFTTSCKKKDKEPTPTPINGKENLTTTSEEARQDIVELTSSEGAGAVASLSNYLEDDDTFLPTGRVSSNSNFRETYKAKARKFRKTFFPASVTKANQRTAEHGFNFSENAGTYTYNHSTGDFDKTSTPTDKIVIVFPSDTTKPSVNDATFTISKYDEVMQINDPAMSQDDTTFLPKAIIGELKIGGVKYASVDFSATYNSEGNPTSLSYNLYLKPFTSTANFTDNGTTATIAATLSKDGVSGTISSHNVTFTFEDNTKEVVTFVKGTSQYRGVSLVYDLNAAKLDEEIPSGTTMATWYNTYAKVTVNNSSDNSKAGDLVFIDITNENGDADIDVKIKFTDGTEKMAEEYFQPVVDELENYFTKLEDENV